jgi:hypothetical protein
MIEWFTSWAVCKKMLKDLKLYQVFQLEAGLPTHPFRFVFYEDLPKDRILPDLIRNDKIRSDDFNDRVIRQDSS